MRLEQRRLDTEAGRQPLLGSRRARLAVRRPGHQLHQAAVSKLQEIVKPTGPQESAFEDLKQASAKAADELRASCPRQSADHWWRGSDEMTAQLDAMVRAVKSLRPTLATFYASLSDEQKAQFNDVEYRRPAGGKG